MISSVLQQDVGANDASRSVYVDGQLASYKRNWLGAQPFPGATRVGRSARVGCGPYCENIKRCAPCLVSERGNRCRGKVTRIAHQIAAQNLL